MDVLTLCMGKSRLRMSHIMLGVKYWSHGRQKSQKVKRPLVPSGNTQHRGSRRLSHTDGGAFVYSGLCEKTTSMIKTEGLAAG